MGCSCRTFREEPLARHSVWQTEPSQQRPKSVHEGPRDAPPVFRCTALMQRERRFCASSFGVRRFWRSSVDCRPVWLDDKLGD